MNDTAPLVSVYLSSYNHAQELAESIDSVLGQTWQDFELVIVDDCSTDSSWDTIKEYEQRDKRVRGVRNERNLYHTLGAELIASLRGRYIAVQHSDDIWEKERLEKGVTYLESHPSCGAVFSQVTVIGDDGKCLQESTHLYQSIFEQRNRSRTEWLHYFFYEGNCLCHPSLLIRKECYKNLGFYDVRFRQMPDLDFWVRLCLRYDIHILPEKLVRFRVHADGSNSSAASQVNFVRYDNELSVMLNHYLAPMTEAEFLAIFPEARQWISERGYVQQYLFARLCLDARLSHAYHRVGLRLLYECMSSAQMRANLRAWYDFDYFRLYEISALYDLTHRLPVDFLSPRLWLGEEGRRNSLRIDKLDWQSDKLHLEVQIRPDAAGLPLFLQPVSAYWPCQLEDIEAKLDGEPLRVSLQGGPAVIRPEGDFCINPFYRLGDTTKTGRLELCYRFTYMSWNQAVDAMRVLAVTEQAVQAYQRKLSNVEEKLIQAWDEINAIKNSRSMRLLNFLRRFRPSNLARHLRRLMLSALQTPVSYEAKQLDAAPAYMTWLAAQRPDEVELARQSGASFAKEPLISIVVPTYNVKPDYLEALVFSLLSQTYQKWELLLVDGGSTDSDSRKALAALPVRDSRLRVYFLSENRGISGNTNEAIKAARGEYIAFSDHDDFWETDALYHIVKTINEQSAEIIYTDEDKVDEAGKVFYDPHLKPDYSPETLMSANYMNHLTVVAKNLLDTVGLLDTTFDGSQDHEFLLRAVETTESERIAHVPRVLYHWRQFNRSMSGQHLEHCQACGRRAVAEHLARLGIKGDVSQLHGYQVHYQLQGILSVTVLCYGVVSEAVRDEYLHVWKKRTGFIDAEFVYAGAEIADINMAASQSRRLFLVLVPLEAEPVSEDWLSELLGQAQQDGIGAVGGRILQPDGRHLYAAGGVIQGGMPFTHYYGQPLAELGQDALERLTRNVSVLPADMLITQRADFEQLHGLTANVDLQMSVADYCLRLLELGRRNVFTPAAELRLQSERSVQKWSKEEQAWFVGRWPGLYEKYYGRTWQM